MKKHYETHVEDTDKLISVAGPVLDYKSWYEQYRKLMEEQAQRKYGLYTPTSEGDDDDFPSIPGMIARYSALGLTNEQMKQNPVWVDKTGNGHDLRMKNFIWGGMSGVGGYEMNFNLWTNNVPSIPDISMSTTTTSVSVSVRNSTYNNNLIYIHRNNWDINKNHWLKVTSTYEDGDLVFKFYNDNNSKNIELPANGYVNIPAHPEFKGNYMYISTTSNKQGSFTIEQLPLYPGFILGDGVDDFAITEKELNFEDTYTVYTAFIPFLDDPARNMVLCGKNHLKDFYITYSDLNRIIFYSAEKLVFESLSKGFNILCCKRTPDKMVIKNLITGKSSEILANALIDNPGLYYLWKGAVFANYAKAAIAGQTICNGYFSTDEDDEKVLDWYKKQYPWLFPDQAWTVVGKTNEDEDRATIANITGNGNDLVLSNFGFAEGSGYGLYAENYSNSRWFINNSITATKKSDTFNVTSINQVAVQIQYIAEPSQSPYTVPSYTIKVTGLTDGQTVNYRVSGGISYPITQDGIYILPGFDFAGMGSWYGFQFNKVQESCDITIEQIPEYEGYLVTDGVDDEVRSAAFTLNEDWTIVGNWEFITNENKNAGLTKVYSFYLYNRDYGIFVYKYINAGQGFSVEDVKSLKAICSDGRIYLNDWQEIRNNIEQEATISKGVMAIGYFNRDFTKMAFKNLGIYNNQLLSKDECIKAYSYLQTLKAK